MLHHSVFLVKQYTNLYFLWVLGDPFYGWTFQKYFMDMRVKVLCLIRYIRVWNEIFQCVNNVRFAGLHVFICGVFYQLPSAKRLPIYATASSVKGYLSLGLLITFKKLELTKFMKQRGGVDSLVYQTKFWGKKIDDNVRKHWILGLLKEWFIILKGWCA